MSSGLILSEKDKDRKWMGTHFHFCGECGNDTFFIDKETKDETIITCTSCDHQGRGDSLDTAINVWDADNSL